MGCRILYIPKPVSGIFYPEYGLLYHYKTVEGTGDASLFKSGWHVASQSEYQSSITYLGGGNLQAGKFKETGTTRWLTPNAGATNETGFNGVGAGFRTREGIFQNLKATAQIVTSTIAIGVDHIIMTMRYNDAFGNASGQATSNSGFSVRGVKDSTTLSHGQTGLYIGTDGKIYRTVCINNLEWLADNLAETRLRDGSIIPWHGADPVNFFTNSEWAALDGPGCCAYNNIPTNVAPGFTFPT